MRSLLIVMLLCPAVLVAQGAGSRQTARERAYLEMQQYDDAPLDIGHYKTIILGPMFKASADEPLLPAWSLTRARQYLDTVTTAWVGQNRCGSCHTGLPYLTARPMIGGMKEEVPQRIREALYTYLAGITTRQAAAEARGVTTVGQETMRGQLYLRVPTTAMLAVSDGMTGTSDPRTLAEYDRVWAQQRPDGSWYWPVVKGMLPFLERDQNYVATLAVLGAGYLPKEYFEQAVPKAGLQRAISYLGTQAPKDLHGELVLLWAAVRTPALMDSARKQRTLSRLRAMQREDGGWNLPSLGAYRRHDGKANDPIHDPSDGYATGLAAFVLCEAGAPAADPAVQRGLTWLKGNQRASGRWYTRSLYSDLFQNYLSNMGTAYAVMAIQRCA
jgi:squalene-hopene/tetraprenyl-beta-curcumene cyclase